MSKENQCLPSELKESLVIFPDGFGVGTSSVGDIILLEFTSVIENKSYAIKRFALTEKRAEDLVTNLKEAIERCQEKNSKEKKEPPKSSK